MSPSPAWREEALCANMDPAEADRIFFIPKGGSLKPAKEFCSKCPVRVDCLKHAILYRESGIWAGTNDKERAKLVKLGIAKVDPHETQSKSEEPLTLQGEQ
jgi:Transcription factor WhiB